MSEGRVCCVGHRGWSGAKGKTMGARWVCIVPILERSRSGSNPVKLTGLRPAPRHKGCIERILTLRARVNMYMCVCLCVFIHVCIHFKM